MLQDGPFALLFVAFAFGWRGIANNRAWQIYFAFVGTRLIYLALENLPYNWSDNFLAVKTAWTRGVLFPFPGASQTLLVAALVIDLMPRRPNRPWTHWAAAIQPVLLAILTIAVWQELPRRDLPIWFF
jgi:hypothetical protein